MAKTAVNNRKPQAAPQKNKSGGKPENLPSTRRAASAGGAGGMLSTEGVSADILKIAKQNQGAGSSSDAADNIIPFIYVLHQMSPVAMPRNPAYIEGAEAGDFWLKNSADQIVKGEEGFEFQPVFFSKCWLEWKPDRGGFVAKHATRPEDAEEVVVNKKTGKMGWQMPNGNDVIETREVAGFVLGRGAPMPYVMTFKGSGHTIVKAWNTTCQQKVSADGTKWPAWSFSYHITSQYRSNDQGDWFLPKIEQGEDLRVDTDAFMRGYGLFKAFSSGQKVTEDYADDTAGTDDDM